MIRGVAMLVLAGFAFGLAPKPALAEAAENPYSGIVVRNVFNLRPPPRPEDNLPPPQAPPKITLTGITTILGNKRALMKVQVPAAPGKPASEESFILAEGQREGEIEVVSIDPDANTVKVNNHGVAQELNFEKDGIKLATAPPPPGSVPPPGPFGGMPQPGLPTTPYQQGRTAPFNTDRKNTFPSRTLRLPAIPGSQPGRPAGFPAGQPPAMPGAAGP